MDFNSTTASHNVELFINDEPTMLANMGKLAAKIAYYNFEWRYVTIIMFNVVQTLGLDAFFIHYDKSVIVKLGRFIPRKRASIRSLVLYGESTNDLVNTIRWLIKSDYDSTAKMILVCTATDYSQCDESQLFQSLTQNKVINVIFLRGSNESDEPTVFSYHIILPGKCFNEVPEKLDLTTNCANDMCFMDLFPEKLMNFHRCSLIISTYEQPPFMYLHNGTMEPSGADGEIIKLIAGILNASLSIIVPEERSDWGHFVESNWTGSLGDAYNGRAHASICFAPLTSHKYGNFQISISYYSMDTVWAARLPALKPSWEKLLYPLKIQLRIALLFIFIGIIFMNTFTKTDTWRKLRTLCWIEPPKANLLFYSWVVFLGMPIMRMSKKPTFLILLYTWLWFCFIIRTVYQATLINAIKLQDYEDRLGSFEDARRNGYPYGGPSSLREYYLEDRNIYDTWMFVDLVEAVKVLDDILDGNTDFVIALNKETILHHQLKYNGTKQLQIIPRKIINTPSVIYFRKFSTLASPVNRVLSVMSEGGFIQRSYDKNVWQDRRRIEYGPAALKMKHFTGSFVLLFTGWFVSMIYFLVEIFFR